MSMKAKKRSIWSSVGTIFISRLMWHKKNAQLEMNEIGPIMEEELQEISGSFATNFIG